MRRGVKRKAAIVQQYDKKGVSAVVATVLILLIVVAAVAILWTFIIPLIRDSTQFDVINVDLTVDKTNGYTYWINENNTACVQIKRGNDDSCLSGIKVVFSVEGNSLKGYFEASKIPGPNEEKQDCFNLSGFGVPESVSVAAIIGTKEGTIVSTVNVIPSVGLGVLPPSSFGGVTSGSRSTKGTVGRVENNYSGCGGSGSGNDNPEPGCIAMTCAELEGGKQCGNWTDTRCGGVVYCPVCQMGQICDNGQCVNSCVPSKTCAVDYSGQCGGSLSNGCTNSLNCSGSCTVGQACNSTGWCAFSPMNIQLSSCGTLNQPYGIYTLINDVSSSGTCFNITANNIVLDINGKTITGDLSRNNYGVNDSGNYTTIKNGKITRFDAGIYLKSNINNLIQNVTTTYNWFGVFLSNSSNNTLTLNNISSNLDTGLWIYSGSNNNKVTSNIVNLNPYGIDLYYQNSNNILTSNIVSFNGQYGIYMYSNSNNNTLTSNTANFNSRGINLYYAVNNTLTSNTANNNTYYGIYLETSSNNNLLVSNTAKFNNMGISLYSSHRNNLTSNTAKLNSYGVFMASSLNNTLTLNDLTSNSNTGYGVYLSSSNNNTLTSNNASSNYRGIYLDYSSTNKLLSNFAYCYAPNVSIYLFHSNSNSGANSCSPLLDNFGTGNTVTCG